jgi:alkanesulfonate monooxygenase SsuD/methylene tetrahydromethanopterin reductase-like flavin-dependent oxidoreductase (luciferase family)
VKFDLFTQIAVAPEWSDALERRTISETIEQLCYADQLGYTTAWLAKHHGTKDYSHSSAPDIVFGALSTQTSALRFGLGVELLPTVHPVHVAERAATLDVLSGGRVDVGTGRSSGPEQLRIFGIDPETTRDRWLESIRLLPRLWTEENVVHHGAAWSWDQEITCVPRPVQKPHPPLWVAASRPGTAALAGAHGIGLMVSSLREPVDLRQAVTAYRETIGQPSDQIGLARNDQVAVMTIAVCHEAGDLPAGAQARAAVYEHLRRIHPGFRERRSAAQEAEAFERGILHVGDPRHMIGAFRELESMGADRVVLFSQIPGVPHDTVMHSLELIAQEVMPAFQASAQAR